MIFWPCSIIYGLVPGQEIYIWLYWPSTRLVNHYIVYQAMYDMVIFADEIHLKLCNIVRICVFEHGTSFYSLGKTIYCVRNMCLGHF